MTPFWRSVPGGVILAVKVQPKSRRPGLQGWAPAADGVRLRIGVREAAEGGQANRAVCELVAELLEVPNSAVNVAQGVRSRLKTLRATGDSGRLVQALVTF